MTLHICRTGWGSILTDSWDTWSGLPRSVVFAFFLSGREGRSQGVEEGAREKFHRCERSESVERMVVVVN